MSPVQRNRTAALLKASGFEDAPALTVQSTDGEIPHGRELSFAWLTGTVMTGLTSVMLMAAALYVSFQGQDTFSTAYEALQIITNPAQTTADSGAKGDRVRPIVRAKSELEIVEASIKETVDGRDMIRKQPFVRIRATLATAATSLTDDIPPYDPVKMLEATQSTQTDPEEGANPTIYGADVEGEVSIKSAAMPVTLVPPRAISDQAAADFVQGTVDNLFGDGGGPAPGSDTALAYAPSDTGVYELGIVEGGVSGVAENVTVMPQTKTAESAGQGRKEKFVTIRDSAPLTEALLRNGFTEQTAEMMSGTLRNVLPTMTMPSGARLRMLFGSLTEATFLAVAVPLSGIILTADLAVPIILGDQWADAIPATRWLCVSVMIWTASMIATQLCQMTNKLRQTSLASVVAVPIAAVAYFVSDAAGYVTGIAMPIDGGFLASGAR